MTTERSHAIMKQMACEIVQEIKSTHSVCVQAENIATIAEQSRGIKEDVQEIKAAVTRMSQQIVAMAAKQAQDKANIEKELAIIKAEKKLVASIVGGIIGTVAGGSGLVGLLHYLKGGAP